MECTVHSIAVFAGTTNSRSVPVDTCPTILPDELPGESRRALDKLTTKRKLTTIVRSKVFSDSAIVIGDTVIL